MLELRVAGLQGWRDPSGVHVHWMVCSAPNTVERFQGGRVMPAVAASLVIQGARLYAVSASMIVKGSSGEEVLYHQKSPPQPGKDSQDFCLRSVSCLASGMLC
ncbi:hypothetical protein HPG69_008837 [Diceros bicornis minor]|uniref:Uncharacterized protein n=1 Tax=Diceros bicornis minor TaxID=77932 RepID=A0A7J7FBR2_DICBM|nr:hypothetical protein HPG69_008837 [Diceros bicornis minor]